MRIPATVREEAKSFLMMLAILGAFLYAANALVAGLKESLNTAVQAQCLASAPQTAATFEKYNDVVKSLIQHEKVSESKDLKDHLGSNAANDAALVARLKGDRIPIYKPNCSRPFLP